MEDLKKAIARCEIKLLKLKETLALKQKVDLKKQDVFQKNFDEVLNRSILSLFRKNSETLNHTHEHRTVKIINGEIVQLRLDFLHGQADGMKVLFARENLTMYIWFSPQVHTGKIVFKIMCAAHNIHLSQAYFPEEIDNFFLPELISEMQRSVSIANTAPERK